MIDFEKVYYRVQDLINSRQGLNTWVQRSSLQSLLTATICECTISLAQGGKVMDTSCVVEFLDIMENSEAKDLPVNEYFTWWDVLPKELTQDGYLTELFGAIEYSIMKFAPGATGPGEVASCLFNKNSVYNPDTKPGDLEWNGLVSEYKAFYTTGWKNINNLCTPDKFNQYAKVDNIDRLVGVTMHPEKPSVMACADLKNGNWSDVFQLVPMNKTNKGKWTCKSTLGIPSFEFKNGMHNWCYRGEYLI